MRFWVGILEPRAGKRVFDAISSICIPVIFDPLLVLPFQANVPYERMTISAPFISSTSVVGEVLNTLRNFKKSEIVVRKQSCKIFLHTPVTLASFFKRVLC